MPAYRGERVRNSLVPRSVSENMTRARRGDCRLGQRTGRSKKKKNFPFFPTSKNDQSNGSKKFSGLNPDYLFSPLVGGCEKL